jgi:DNA invertase Pin-like site-specific DNA recombinase
MGRILGYARISTDDQSLALQRDALTAAGAERIFEDVVSGATASRPGLDALLAELRDGDTLVIWRLDRLGRSVLNLATLAEDLRRRGIALRSLTEGLDTGTASGRMVYSILAALAEYERELIRERVRAGMAAAKRSGLHVGRRRKMSSEHACDAAARLDAGEPARRVAAYFRVSEATLYRATRPLRGNVRL